MSVLSRQPASRPDRQPDAAFPDLVVVGQEPWGPLARRNRLMIEALAAANPASRFLFIEAPVRPRQMLTQRPHRARPVAANIWTARPRRPLPSGVGAALADRLEAQQITAAAEAAGLRRPVLWTQDPRCGDLLEHLTVAGLIYDLTDDWEAFEPDPDRRSRVGGQIRRLLHAADLVFACSENLCAYGRARGADPVLVPNAAGDMTVAAAAHPGLAAVPEPRLGYLGTLHEARLDLDLLLGAAAARPDWSFVCVGPDHLTAAGRRRLAEAPNVFCLGPCPYEEVPAYLHGFTVGLMPHLLNPLSESLDPLKLYEYANAGLPILATPAGIPPELAGVVSLVRSPGELVRAASEWLDGDAGAADPRAAAPQAAALNATWTERAARVQRAWATAAPRGDAATAPGSSTPTVSVVIVSFNTAALTLRAVRSVLDQDVAAQQILVVDNGSDDGSVAAIRAAFPEVELIAAGANLGFGPANNRALAHCRGEYVLLLNSDAELHPGALAALLLAAERHPGSAVLGPRLLNPDGSLQRSAWPFPTAGRMLVEAVGLHRLLRRTPWWEDLGTWAHDGERTVDFLVGACLLIRRAALDAVGGFDESFPLYAEETDLQYRITQRGSTVTFVPGAQVTHAGGGSSSGAPARARLFLGAQLRYLHKHSGRTGMLGGRLALALGALLRGRWALVPLAFSPVPVSLDPAPAAPATPAAPAQDGVRA